MLRRAAIQDLDKIMYIVDEVKEEMRQEGSDQFDDTYPTEEHFRDDIENGHLYIRSIGTNIAGIICINNKEIINSSHLNWSKCTPCTAFYRLIVNKLYRRSGIGKELVLLAEDISRRHRLNYVKAATYELNKSMISLFEKLNYRFVGKINVETRKYPFYCYEKLL